MLEGKVNKGNYLVFLSIYVIIREILKRELISIRSGLLTLDVGIW